MCCCRTTVWKYEILRRLEGRGTYLFECELCNEFALIPFWSCWDVRRLWCGPVVHLQRNTSQSQSGVQASMFSAFVYERISICLTDRARNWLIFRQKLECRCVCVTCNVSGKIVFVLVSKFHSFGRYKCECTLVWEFSCYRDSEQYRRVFVSAPQFCFK